MKWKALSIAALVAGPLTHAAAAQQTGALELGVFGTWHRFDHSVQLDNRLGGGALAAFFFARNVSIEADASYTRTRLNTSPAGEVTYIPVRGRLVGHVSLHRSASLELGAGYVYARYGRSVAQNDNGATGLIGFRVGNGTLGGRIDGVVDYFPSPYNKAAGFVSRNIHYSVRAGISLLLGGRASQDRDGDGVPDRLDRCPATAVGAAVDASGCALPKDTDRDGVLDAMDRCPDTPAGARVDDRGCPVRDSDGDGVLDNADRCAGTPAGTKVDSVGCPLPVDNDGDGVLDAQDKCKDTPAGLRVDATGCPIDRDRDGVVDAADRCPDTPQGTTVDGSGCPITDSDSDGIPDSKDRCPGTPAGMLVGPNGCLALFEGKGERVMLEGVTFQSASSRLTIDARKVLDFVAQSLQANPTIRVEIQGYTDSRGSAAANRRLSLARASSVRAYLIRRGVDPGRLTARGYGESDPVADNSTAEGRERNRRVELKKT